MKRRRKIADLNPRTMPGPGDLWGSPEDDEEPVEPEEAPAAYDDVLYPWEVSDE